jgi:hypothetical protein
MLYKILNNLTVSKIERLRPVAIKYLSNALDGPGAEAASDRLVVDIRWAQLINHFSSDNKRKYMINRNYVNFLKAIIYLYQTSSTSIQAGVLMAPAEVYNIISSVKKSFEDATTSLGIK